MRKIKLCYLRNWDIFWFYWKLKFSIFVNLLILHKQLTYFLFHFSSFVLVLVFLTSNWFISITRIRSYIPLPWEFLRRSTSMSEEGRSQVSLPHRTQKSPFKSIEVKALLETHIDFIFAHNLLILFQLAGYFFILMNDSCQIFINLISPFTLL